jgi:hypothetical protein
VPLVPGEIRALEHGDSIWLGEMYMRHHGKDILNECTFVYQHMEVPSVLLSNAVDSVTCAICYEVFHGNSGRSVVPCGHTFCSTCVSKGCCSPGSRCPMCRTTVMEPGTIPFRCESIVRMLIPPAHLRVDLGLSVQRVVDYEVDDEEVMRLPDVPSISDRSSRVSRSRLDAIIRRVKQRSFARVSARHTRTKRAKP